MNNIIPISSTIVICIQYIKLKVKNFPTKRTLIPEYFITKFYQTRRNNIKSSQTQVIQEKGEFPRYS